MTEEDHDNYHNSVCNLYDTYIPSHVKKDGSPSKNNFENYVHEDHIKNNASSLSLQFEPIIEMRLDADFCPDFTSDHDDDMDMESD
jgi:hypothetical protein